MQGVYKIENLQNGKVYIGSSVNLKKRWKDHRWMLRNGRHRNIHLQAAWDKFGEGSFAFSMLEEVIETDMLLPAEQKYLDGQFGQDCYNIAQDATAPMLGRNHTDETRRKIGAVHTGNQYNVGRKHTEEAKRNMGAAQVGNKKCLGYKHTEATKRKMSKALIGNKRSLGYKHTDETKRKLRAASLGKKPTEEARRKMSAAAMGNQNWLGKKHTDETKRKIGAASKGRKCTEETRRKLSVALRGRTLSDETRRKLSEAKKQWWARKRAESLKETTAQCTNVHPAQRRRHYGAHYLRCVRVVRETKMGQR